MKSVMIETNDILKGAIVLGHHEERMNPPKNRNGFGGWCDMNMKVMDELEHITLNWKHRLPYITLNHTRWSAIVSTPVRKGTPLLVRYVCINAPDDMIERHVSMAFTSRFTGRGYESWLFGTSPKLSDMMAMRVLYECADDEIESVLITKQFQLRVIARTREIGKYPPPF